MSGLIEDYALIGSTGTTALVSRGGSIDWWCVPNVDSGACFAALLGNREHGRWLLQPASPVIAVRRRYLPDTLVLETEFDTAEGTVAVLDFMLPDPAMPTIFRTVEGRAGTVPMRFDLVVRFDYGSVVPWVRSTGDGLLMVAGPDALRLHSPVKLTGVDLSTRADFAVTHGEHRSFSLAYHSSLSTPPLPVEVRSALVTTIDWWRRWVAKCNYDGEWRDEVVRSLITLKALTFAPTGAVVAAATTSLPEELGGARNWDYRYTWLRDASFTLRAFRLTGYGDEATAWNDWLRRAVAGSPGDFQIMYDINGRRRLTEVELDWLPGYADSAPVRIGNAASTQFQLDVYGEVLDAIESSFEYGVCVRDGAERDIVLSTMESLDKVWREPDSSLWEVRGPRRHFTHSKVMAWVAYDRAIQLADRLEVPAEAVEQWRRTRDEVKELVCAQGWDPEKNSFVQYFGSDALDASALVYARVGFLPPHDPRIVGTIEAIQRELVVDGLVKRYLTSIEADQGSGDATVDGLPGHEGTFLIGSFWLAQNLALIGRHDQARELFERLRCLANDVGLFAEEYDPIATRMLGNVPQAFSHLAFVVTAVSLSGGARGELTRSPAAQRACAEDDDVEPD